MQDFLNQKATYWIGEPDGYGNYIWGDPTVIDVRFQEKREKTKDADGEEVVSEAQVWMYEDLPYQTKSVRLFEGETTETDPHNVDSYEIINRASRIDIYGNQDGYKVWL